VTFDVVTVGAWFPRHIEELDHCTYLMTRPTYDPDVEYQHPVS